MAHKKLDDIGHCIQVAIHEFYQFKESIDPDDFSEVQDLETSLEDLRDAWYQLCCQREMYQA